MALSSQLQGGSAQGVQALRLEVAQVVDSTPSLKGLPVVYLQVTSSATAATAPAVTI